MASQENDNPSAFPRVELRDSYGCGIREGADGMTLRDYFAGQAVVATLIAMANGQHGVQPGKSVIETAAADSYAVADAMLAARVPA